MSQITEEQIRDIVVERAREFGVHTSRIEIGTNEYDDADSTVRIVVELKNLQKVNLADLQKLIGAVEESMSDQDDRYPSIRFAEAA